MRRIERPSPNHDARPANAPIDMLVLHYTGMRDAAAALDRLCDPAAKVSAHYTIDEDGTVYAMVPEESRAWHAGMSFWAGETNVNARSIGIELVNPGHEFGYRDFAPAQIEALIALGHEILARHPIPPRHVLGHSDVAPARKDDPGELFPWQQLAQAGIGLFPLPEGVRRTGARPSAPSGGQGEGAFSADALTQFGYDPEAPRDKRITAFQRHFRPAKLDGIWDAECAGLLAGLLAASGV